MEFWQVYVLTLGSALLTAVVAILATKFWLWWFTRR